MPKVSVLMGVYNCEKTVSEAIDSIIGQTFADWELIICDDGSTDKTYEIIKLYEKQDKRIKILQNNVNQGLSYSLNRCLKESDSEYCARMDGDDISDTIRLKKLVSFLDSNDKFGFVSSKMKRFDEEGFYEGDSYSLKPEPDTNDLVAGSPYCHAPVMIRREAYEKVGGYRDIPMTRGVEDYDLWFRLHSKGIYGYNLADELYFMFDGRDANRRRTFKRRLNEAYVRLHGYNLLHVSFIKRFFFLKPIILGLIPNNAIKQLRRIKNVIGY